MEQSSNPFIPLLIVIFLAFIVPVILARFKKLHLPIVVGEIIAGILIGRSGFGLVSPDEPILDFIAEFGFVFLMFLSGMEIDFSSLGLASKSATRRERHRWGPVSLGFASFGLTLLLAALVSIGLVQLELARNPWMMGLILSTTSLGVVVPVLKENGLINGPFGQSLLIAALIADFVTMFCITILVAILSQGLAFNILLIGLLFVAFFLMLRFGQIFSRLPAARRAFEELSHATAQIKVRGAFTLMLAFVVLSIALGTEVILGAFLAGASFALLMTSEDKPVVHQLESIGYGFLIPVFFIKVGMDFDLEAFLSSSKAIWLTPLLIAAALLVKVVPALIFRLRFGWRETISAGVLLSARLSLIIAASAVGLRLGIISSATNAAVVLVAILTVTLTPVLFSALAPPRHVAPSPPMIVIGAGELGLQIVEQLRAHNEEVIILDYDETRVNRARHRGFTAMTAAVEANDAQAESVLSGAHTFICTYANTERSYRACQVARTVYGIPHVVAHVSSPSELTRFRNIGVSATNAALDHAALLTLLARNPATYSLLTRTDDNKEVYEVLIENIDCADKTLRQIQLPGDTLALAVRRNGELLVPHGNTRIECGDYLTLISSLEYVEQGRQLFAEIEYSQ